MHEEEYQRFLHYRNRNVRISIFMAIVIIIVSVFIIAVIGDTIAIFLGTTLLFATIAMLGYAFMIRNTNLYTNGELKHLILACENEDELRDVDERCRNFVGSCFFQFDERRALYRDCRNKIMCHDMI